MEKREVIELARGLFLKHGLSEWTFEIYKRKRSCGTCFYTKKKIAISKFLIKYATDEQIKQILLHEMAHALCGVDIGHGRVFKYKCREIGCTEETYKISFELNYTEESVYDIICQNCGVVGEYYRKSKQVESAIKNNTKLFSCNKCNSKCSIKRGNKK